MNLGELNWPEIVSAVIAAFALVVAIRVGIENRKYKAPDFRITAAGQNGRGKSMVKMTNNGETPAKDVKLTLAMDPTGMFTSKPLEWAVIDKNEPVLIVFDQPNTHNTAPYADWLSFVLTNHPERRDATVEYTNRLGKRVSMAVLLPSETETVDAIL